MTVLKFLLVIFSLLVMFVGIYLIYRDQKIGKKQVVLPDDAYDKDGKPVIPRHLRKFSKDQTTENKTPVASEKQKVDGENDTINNTTKVKIDSANSVDKDSEKDKNNFTELYTTADGIVGKDDKLKSNLNIPPVIINSDSHTETDVSSVSNSLLSEDDEKAIHAISELDVDGNDDDNEREDTESVDESEETEDSNKLNNNLLNDMLTANSPLLDEHLQTADKEQHSPLTDAEDNINISILPNNEFSHISGDKLLELVENYGFKFGAMNMFHRYENKDGTGILWFSMMGLTKDGIVPFDITTLADTSELKGLVMFLPLPHPNVLQGFDSMMSIANMMARQLTAYVVDEEGDPMTNEYKKKLRSLLQTTLVDEKK